MLPKHNVIKRLHCTINILINDIIYLFYYLWQWKTHMYDVYKLWIWCLSEYNGTYRAEFLYALHKVGHTADECNSV